MPVAIALLLMGLLGAACERDTKLVIEPGDPLKFVLSGSGTLGTLRIRGPKRQREVSGEDGSIYWKISPAAEGTDRHVEELGPITYGVVPSGYVQIYPRHGEVLPPLIQGERYNIRVATNNADGVSKFFIIRNGKVEVSEY